MCKCLSDESSFGAIAQEVVSRHPQAQVYEGAVPVGCLEGHSKRLADPRHSFQAGMGRGMMDEGRKPVARGQ